MSWRWKRPLDPAQPGVYGVDLGAAGAELGLAEPVEGCLDRAEAARRRAAGCRTMAQIRDPIRRDKDRVEQKAFDRLKAELTHAFVAPESSYQQLTQPR